MLYDFHDECSVYSLEIHLENSFVIPMNKRLPLESNSNTHNMIDFTQIPIKPFGFVPIPELSKINNIDRRFVRCS